MSSPTYVPSVTSPSSLTATQSRPSQGRPSQGRPSQDNMNIETCITFMVRFLQRTPEVPYIRLSLIHI